MRNNRRIARTGRDDHALPQLIGRPGANPREIYRLRRRIFVDWRRICNRGNCGRIVYGVHNQREAGRCETPVGVGHAHGDRCAAELIGQRRDGEIAVGGTDDLPRPVVLHEVFAVRRHRPAHPGADHVDGNVPGSEHREDRLHDVGHRTDRRPVRLPEHAPLCLQNLVEQLLRPARLALVEQEFAQAGHGPERVLVVGAEGTPREPPLR